MNYGLPYKGSKNKLATRIVDLLPRRKHFYDLFCGGCAVTHAAMLSNKWEHFTINDLNWQCPTLFVDALNGKYKNDTRWISREDFFRLKDSDPYVAFVWSFGNNQKTYLYSQDIEPLKRAIHFALFFGDYEPSKQLGCDLSFIDRLPTREQKYSAIRKYFKNRHDAQVPNNLVFTGGGENSAQRSPQPSWSNRRPYEMQNLEAANRLSGLAQKKKEPIRFRALRSKEPLVTDSNIRSEYTASRSLVGGG